MKKKWLICLFIGSAMQLCAEETTDTSAVKSGLYKIGVAIRDTHVPIVGKLGNILPFALMSFSLRKFPEQTLCALAAGALYVLYNNENVRQFLYNHNILNAPAKRNTAEEYNDGIFLEDDFFVFEGEDAIDGEEEESDEDELLDDVGCCKDH